MDPTAGSDVSLSLTATLEGGSAGAAGGGTPNLKGETLAIAEPASSRSREADIEPTAISRPGSQPGVPRPASGTADPLSVPSRTTATNPTATRASAAVQVTPSLPSPAPGGHVTVGGLGSPDSLDPVITETDSGRAVTSLLFDSLLDYETESGQLIPRLASGWTIASDSRTVTFTLRSNARWHDGQPVVAEDVVFSLDRVRDPALDSLLGPPLEHVADVMAYDDRTLVVRLDVADCPSLAALGVVPILPQHLLTTSDGITGTFSSTPIGSGPFVLGDWKQDGEIHLLRNADYWGNVPYLETLSYRSFEAFAEMQAALDNEQIDVALMPRDYRGEVGSSSGATRTYRYPATEYLFVAFNNDLPVLDEANVRQALSMAVDRQQLIEQTLNGAGELIAASLPTSHWAADPDLQPPAYDPEAARQLLLAAGWSDSDGDGWLDRDGERLRLPVRTNGGNRLREDVAAMVAGYYRAIGIDARLELATWGAVVDDLFTHDFDAIVFSWPLQAEPDQSSWWLSTEDEIGRGYNVVSFADDQIDRLLQTASTVPACDRGRRAQLYREVQRLLAEERPYDFLFVPYAVVMARSELRGLSAGPFAGPLESAPAWYVAP